MSRTKTSCEQHGEGATPARSGGSYILYCEPGHIRLDGGATTFDPPDPAGLWLSRTLDTIAEASPHLGELDVVERLRRELHASLTELRSNSDTATAAAGLAGIASALHLGFLHLGGKEVRVRIEAEAKALSDQMRVAPAHAGRRTPSVVTDIIARRAEELWNDAPSFRGNHQGTAYKIWKKVVSDIRKLPMRPKAWEKFGVSKPESLSADRADEEKRFIERIRGCLRRLPLQGN